MWRLSVRCSERGRRRIGARDASVSFLVAFNCTLEFAHDNPQRNSFHGTNINTHDGSVIRSVQSANFLSIGTTIIATFFTPVNAAIWSTKLLPHRATLGPALNETFRTAFFISYGTTYMHSFF